MKVVELRRKTFITKGKIYYVLRYLNFESEIVIFVDCLEYDFWLNGSIANLGKGYFKLFNHVHLTSICYST